MNRLITILGLIFLILITGCFPRPRHMDEVRVIALRPIGGFDRQELDTLRQRTSTFTHKSIVVLPAAPIPPGFLDTTKGYRYSADSIIRWVSPQSNDTIVIGLTDQDIFTTVRNSIGQVKEPVYKYAVWGIFGLGSCPGRSSIISSFRLRSSDRSIYRRRLRTVVLHELGHNLGLPHCPSPGCIMNDANEKIATVDQARDDFCITCRKKLGL